MKIKVYLHGFALLFLSVSICCGQGYEIVQDTATHQWLAAKVTAFDQSNRIQTYDIQASVQPNAARPESTVDVHLNFGPGVNIDDVFTIMMAIYPNCSGPCNTSSVANSWLSTKAINKVARTVDFTFGGMLPGKTYLLQTAIFGLEGAPCGGDQLLPVQFQTATANPGPAKMLMVINEEWMNNSLAQAKFDQYIADIQITDPLISVEKYYLKDISYDKIALYEYIQQQYHNNNLTHLFFIGDNASTLSYTKLLDDAGNVVFNSGSYTFNQYTLPLYKHYTYSDDLYQLQNVKYQNTCFRSTIEVREPVFQQSNSLISMGMIIPNPALSFDGKLSYLLDYFNKLHSFRNKEITFSKKVLLTDGFVSESGAVETVMDNGRWSSATVLAMGREKDYYYSGEDPIWKADFLNRLGTESYEIFSLNVHGSPDYHSFGINKDDIIYNILQLNTQIINLSSCQVGTYKVDNYLAGLYLEKSNVINVHAYSDLLINITVNGESALEFPFRNNGAFVLMSQGYGIADAFRFSSSYNDGEVILGDPLAKLQDSGALPVVLKYFEARMEGNVCRLRWSTVSEANSNRFEVQRSPNGKDWYRIGTILSNGESVKILDYSFIDENPYAGQNLYRLKMIDGDETFAYSKICSVNFNTMSKAVFPNPVSDKIYFPNEILDKTAAVNITDMNGKRVFELLGKPENGISTHWLSTGIYIVNIKRLDGSTKTQRILITR